MKLPALQFYTGDWLKDPAVRLVSYAARGLWIDILCIMSESDPRGYLKVNGNPLSADRIARMTGGLPEEVSPLLSELESAGVFSRDRDGTIVSRRIVRDEKRRRQNQRNGKKGGNPRLRDSDNRPDNPPLKRSPEEEDEDEEEDSSEGGPGETENSALPGESAPKIRDSARRAFDQWSAVSRGGPIREHENEVRHIFALISAVRQGPPVIRNGCEVSADLFVPQAVEMLKLEGAEFRTIQYACKSVRNRVERWVREGAPGETSLSKRKTKDQEIDEMIEHVGAELRAEGKLT